jgi:hypothetical protein
LNGIGEEDVPFGGTEVVSAVFSFIVLPVAIEGAD